MNVKTIFLSVCGGEAKMRPILVVLTLTLAAHIFSYVYFAHIAAGNPQARPYPIVNGDSVHYVILSESLREHGTYTDWSDPLTPRVWTPGYPALLAASKAMMGSYVPIVILQVALALVAVVLIYSIALQFVPSLIASAAALFYGIEPIAVFLNTAIFTDGLFSSVLVIIVYIAFFWRLRGPLLWAIVGALLGLISLIRPIAMYLIPLAPLAYLVSERFNRDWKSKVISICAFVLCASVVVVPWMIRNNHSYGVYEISHSGPFNVLHNFARPFLAWREFRSTQPTPALLVMRMTENPVFQIVDKRIDARLRTLTPVGGDPWNYQGQVAREIIFGDPFRYAYFHAVNMAPFFLASSVSAYQQYVHQVADNTGFYAPTLMSLVKTMARLKGASPSEIPAIIIPIIPIVLEIAFWLAILLSAAWAVRSFNFKILLLACLVAYFAVLTGPIAMARYRVPVEPYLFILAAIGVHSFVKHRRFVLLSK